MDDNKTKEYFDNLAKTGVWPSRYGPMNFTNYNFITRRNSVARILKNDFFSSVLDLGCGTGDYYELLQNHSEKYVGVDFSATMIKQARLRYGNSLSGIEPIFMEGSAEALPLEDNRFDLVCAIGFIEYFDDSAVPIREIIRVLKPEGVLIIQSFQIDLYKKISKVTGMDLAKQFARYIYGIFRKSPAMRFGTDRPYSKNELDQLMGNFGFVKESFLYNNFNIFPLIIRRLFPKAYINCSEKITASCPNFFSIIAVNYIGRYKLSKKQ